MKMKWFKSISFTVIALAVALSSVSTASAASKLSGKIVINGLLLFFRLRFKLQVNSRS